VAPPPVTSASAATQAPAPSTVSAPPAPAGAPPAAAHDQAPTPGPLSEIPAEHSPPPRTVYAGFEHDPAKRWTVYYLGLSLSLITLIGVIPAILEVVDHYQAIESAGVERWARLLLLLAVVQMAYVVYSVQLPDWSTVWVVALVTTAMACLYAAALGVCMFSGQESQLLHALQLADQHYHGQAARWCFLMLCLMLMLTYSYTRVAFRWHRAYQLAIAPRDRAGP